VPHTRHSQRARASLVLLRAAQQERPGFEHGHLTAAWRRRTYVRGQEGTGPLDRGLAPQIHRGDVRDQRLVLGLVSGSRAYMLSSASAGQRDEGAVTRDLLLWAAGRTPQRLFGSARRIALILAVGKGSAHRR